MSRFRPEKRGKPDAAPSVLNRDAVERLQQSLVYQFLDFAPHTVLPGLAVNNVEMFSREKA